MSHFSWTIDGSIVGLYLLATMVAGLSVRKVDSRWALTVACLVWYSTITVYVNIRGAWDIKNMLARLQALRDEQQDEA